MASCGHACSPHLECGHAAYTYTAGLQWAPLETLLCVDSPQSAHSMGSQSGTGAPGAPVWHIDTHASLTAMTDVCVTNFADTSNTFICLRCLLFLPQTCVLGTFPWQRACSGVSPASDSKAPRMRYNQAPRQLHSSLNSAWGGFCCYVLNKISNMKRWRQLLVSLHQTSAIMCWALTHAAPIQTVPPIGTVRNSRYMFKHYCAKVSAYPTFLYILTLM